MLRALLLTILCLVFAAVRADVETRTVNNGNLVLEGVPEIPDEIVSGLRRYHNVRAGAFRDFTADGAGLYISTRFGDVDQLHRVDMPGGSRRQLTFFDEPVGEVHRRPGSDTIAFTMDAGGAEFSQIYLLEPGGDDARLLTDGASRNTSVLWSNAGDRFAYLSTARNGRSNDVWVQAPGKPGSARVVLEAGKGHLWAPVDWSPDDRRLLVIEYVSITDSRIHVLDLESGALTAVAGSDAAPAYNEPFAFSARAGGVYFATAGQGEFNQLAYHDLSSGAQHIVTGVIPWDVEEFAISNDGQRAAFVVNEGGLSALYLLDPSSQHYQRIDDLPSGVIGGLTFSDDGRKLGLTLNTAQTPSDAFVLTLGPAPLQRAALTRWTFSEVGGLDTAGFVSPQLISYPSFDGRDIPAFVYRPQGPGPHPVVISIHGGPEAQFRPYFSSTYQLWLKRLGAAVVAPNVRGSAGYGKSYLKLDNGYRREDSVRDIGALLDWIALQPDMDATRVAVFGGSYGGYMVLASAVHYSDRLAAAVDIVGISHFVSFLENTEDYRRDLRRVEYGDERDPDMRAFLEQISPLNSVDRINVPLFVIQGQNDPRVPVTEAEQMVTALRTAAKPVWYMNALNEGHGYRKKENRDVYQQAVMMFLENFLNARSN